MFAFSSASSVGTLPINMECVEELGSKDRIFCTSIRSNDQYGRNSHLSGRLCNFYCILLRNQFNAISDANESF